VRLFGRGTTLANEFYGCEVPSDRARERAGAGVPRGGRLRSIPGAVGRIPLTSEKRRGEGEGDRYLCLGQGQVAGRQGGPDREDGKDSQRPGSRSDPEDPKWFIRRGWFGLAR